jgi:diacylglycerol kinase (ATP)
MRTVVFVNAGSRQTRRVLSNLKNDLADGQFNVMQVITVGPFRRFSTALRRLRECTRIDCVIIAGGDGTVAGVIHELSRRKVKIGILPLGTGNSFARSLGLPLAYNEALAVIKAGKTQLASLGTVNGRIFVNAAAIGLSATTAHQISDVTKRYLGRLAYVISGARQLIFHKPFECVVETPKKTYRFKTHEIIVANGGYYGGKPVDNHTSAYKDYLTIVAIGPDTGRLRYILGELHLLTGKQKKSAYTIDISTRKAIITTTPRRPVHADGEIITKTPATFETKPKSISVFVP